MLISVAIFTNAVQRITATIPVNYTEESMRR